MEAQQSIMNLCIFLLLLILFICLDPFKGVVQYFKIGYLFVPLMLNYKNSKLIKIALIKLKCKKGQTVHTQTRGKDGRFISVPRDVSAPIEPLSSEVQESLVGGFTRGWFFKVSKERYLR
jgi:hypothetical protein